MANLEVVAKVPEDQQHGSDAEGVRAEGGKIFTCGDDGKVKIFDTNLKLIQEFKAHDYAVYDVYVFGDTLFTCSNDSSIKTWDVNTLQPKKTILKHEEAVRKFCSDGKLIFAGDEKGEVRGYTPDGELNVMYNIVEEVWSMHIKNDLLFTVRDRGITITQVRGEDNKYAHIQSLDGRAPIYAQEDILAFPDSSGTTIEVRENNKDTAFALKGQLKGPEMIITSIGGAGNHLLSGGWDSVIRLFDLTKMAETAKCTLPDVPNGIAATSEGEVFVVGVGGYICKLKMS